MTPISISSLKTVAARHFKPSRAYLSSTSHTYRLYNQIPNHVSTSGGAAVEASDMTFVENSNNHNELDFEDPSGFIPTVASDGDVSVRGHNHS